MAKKTWPRRNEIAVKYVFSLFFAAHFVARRYGRPIHVIRNDRWGRSSFRGHSRPNSNETRRLLQLICREVGAQLVVRLENRRRTSNCFPSASSELSELSKAYNALFSVRRMQFCSLDAFERLGSAEKAVVSKRERNSYETC